MSFFARLGGSDSDSDSSSGSESEESILSGQEGLEQDKKLAASKKPTKKKDDKPVNAKASRFLRSDDDDSDDSDEDEDSDDDEDMSDSEDDKAVSCHYRQLHEQRNELWADCDCRTWPTDS